MFTGSAYERFLRTYVPAFYFLVILQTMSYFTFGKGSRKYHGLMMIPYINVVSHGWVIYNSCCPDRNGKRAPIRLKLSNKYLGTMTFQLLLLETVPVIVAFAVGCNVPVWLFIGFAVFGILRLSGLFCGFQRYLFTDLKMKKMELAKEREKREVFDRHRMVDAHHDDFFTEIVENHQ